MNTINTALTKTIMRHVYVVAFLRKTLFRPVLAKAVLLACLMVATFFIVSVPNIIKNILIGKRFNEQIMSFIQAFLATEIVVKIIVLAAFFLFIGIVVDMAKSFFIQNKKHAY